MKQKNKDYTELSGYVIKRDNTFKLDIKDFIVYTTETESFDDAIAKIQKELFTPDTEIAIESGNYNKWNIQIKIPNTSLSKINDCLDLVVNENKYVAKPKIFELSGLEEAKKVFSPMPEIHTFIITNLGGGFWTAVEKSDYFEIKAKSISAVIAKLMEAIDKNAEYDYTKWKLEDGTYSVQLIKRERKVKVDNSGNTEVNQLRDYSNCSILDLSNAKIGECSMNTIDNDMKAPDTYAYKLFMLCDMQAELKEPQPYLAAWQALNLIRLLLDKNSKGTFVKFSKSDIQEVSPYFCSSDEGSCVSDDLLTEVIAKHVLSCMHILDIADIKHALTYTRERDLDA